MTTKNFNYVGPVMACNADGGLPEVLLPNMTFLADDTDPYIARLVDRGLLVVIPSPPELG